MVSGLTRKHFEELAAALKRVRPHKDGSDDWRQWEHDVHAIAAACAKFNPGFDRSKFLEAAGVKNGN